MTTIFIHFELSIGILPTNHTVHVDHLHSFCSEQMAHAHNIQCRQNWMIFSVYIFCIRMLPCVVCSCFDRFASLFHLWSSMFILLLGAVWCLCVHRLNKLSHLKLYNMLWNDEYCCHFFQYSLSVNEYFTGCDKVKYLPHLNTSTHTKKKLNEKIDNVFLILIKCLLFIFW